MPRRPATARCAIWFLLASAQPLIAAEPAPLPGVPPAAPLRADAEAADMARCDALLGRLESGEDTIETCHALSQALGAPLPVAYREAVVFPRLLAMRHARHAKVRGASHQLLHAHPQPLPVASLAKYFRDEDATVRLLAVRSVTPPHLLAEPGDEAERAEIVGLVLPLMDDPDRLVASAAANKLDDARWRVREGPRLQAAHDRYTARVIAEQLADDRPADAIWNLVQIDLQFRLSVEFGEPPPAASAEAIAARHAARRLADPGVVDPDERYQLGRRLSETHQLIYDIGQQVPGGPRARG